MGGHTETETEKGAMEAETEDQAVGGKGRPLAAQETPQRRQGDTANAPCGVSQPPRRAVISGNHMSQRPKGQI